jgi:hypothetical protein
MPKRALILGGGGAVGIAWESGLLAGFAEGGGGRCAARFAPRERRVLPQRRRTGSIRSVPPYAVGEAVYLLLS